MKKFLITAAAMLMAGAAVAQPGGWVQGKVEQKSVRSEILGVERSYSVYLPKNYTLEPGKQFPVFYLLHGVFDTHMGWPTRGHVGDVANQLIDSGEACDMIIVIPDAGSEWNGYFNMDGWAYEDYFFKELIPHIEASYRVLPGKGNRAIGGLSMGGGGSTSYAQRHPDMFCALYAMSALMDLPESGGIPAQDMKMAELNRSVRELSCVDYVKNADDGTIEKLRTVSWFVDCGDDDFLLDVNLEFFQAMRNAGVPCQLRVRDGGHTWEYWHSALYTALPFVSRNFSKCK